MFRALSNSGLPCVASHASKVIRRANPGVTQKALTQCLRRLEYNGFINRTVVSTALVAVSYEISRLGRSLEPQLD
ncbi:winged helix-turn-helix transcriptional regulator [Pandoraea horticolens]|uniref:winged helix-turn-helix transcriptional regulator n=1 Tax=Pandoraea horticolens TaxID=2508298 RepID=UPI001FE7EB5A|nr:winged helix-turn-helix transcriptional regulator [Pandoraea horticolens]